MITPVSEIVAKMKRVDQKTLTQMLEIPNSESEIEEVSDIDTDFVTKPTKPKKQKVEVDKRTPPPPPRKSCRKPPATKWVFTSRNASDKKDPPRAKIRDLVTSTAVEIGHLDFTYGQIDGAYFFFRVVRSYSIDDLQGKKEKVNVEWSTVI